ncbi:MAG: glutathione S-transferase family protein [Deltaproteobacteria bacterium]|nr:glutathione S-transferase family protein [Deltaproteobacteria bacterium]
MTITLFHHPYSRAANVVWMLEEVGIPYDLRFVDMMAGAHKTPEMLALNPMGKLPILIDNETVVTESAAIGLYLADRYAYGTLAPRHDEPQRGMYLRWSFFGPSVIEPAVMAKAGGWVYKEGQAGWGSYSAMLDASEAAIRDRKFVLGDQFSMVDCLFGGTLRYMLTFKLIEPRPAFVSYVARLDERPAHKRSLERNAAIREEHGLNRA